jgi:hypothetical protein
MAGGFLALVYTHIYVDIFTCGLERERESNKTTKIDIDAVDPAGGGWLLGLL